MELPNIRTKQTPSVICIKRTKRKHHSSHERGIQTTEGRPIWCRHDVHDPCVQLNNAEHPSLAGSAEV